MWDPNLRGKLLRGWARQLGLQLLNRAGHPTCVRPQRESVVDLVWRLPAISGRFLGWGLDGEETLSDHKLIKLVIECGVVGARSFPKRGEWEKRYPQWLLKGLDEDFLGAALNAIDWLHEQESPRVEHLTKTLEGLCRMTLRPRVRATGGRRVVHWWREQIASLRRVANPARRRWARAKHRRTLKEVTELLTTWTSAKKNLGAAIKRAKAQA
ncbi:hypothetical protein M0802_012015 [Mischocyttarus mexicanus]|nr:hypothetical protein M0802_012015 [Mischocyttarus mexicanus]